MNFIKSAGKLLLVRPPHLWSDYKFQMNFIKSAGKLLPCTHRKYRIKLLTLFCAQLPSCRHDISVLHHDKWIWAASKPSSYMPHTLVGWLSCLHDIKWPPDFQWLVQLPNNIQTKTCVSEKSGNRWLNFWWKSAKSAWYSRQVYFSVSNNVHENLLLPTVQALNSIHRRNRGIHLQCSHVTGC